MYDISRQRATPNDTSFVAPCVRTTKRQQREGHTDQHSAAGHVVLWVWVSQEHQLGGWGVERHILHIVWHFGSTTNTKVCVWGGGGGGVRDVDVGYVLYALWVNHEHQEGLVLGGGGGRGDTGYILYSTLGPPRTPRGFGTGGGGEGGGDTVYILYSTLGPPRTPRGFGTGGGEGRWGGHRLHII